MVRAEIFIEYMRQGVGEGGDLHKYIRRGVCVRAVPVGTNPALDINKSKLAYSNCKS